MKPKFFDPIQVRDCREMSFTHGKLLDALYIGQVPGMKVHRVRVNGRNHSAGLNRDFMLTTAAKPA